MKYAILIYSGEDAGPAMGTPEQAAEMQEWFAYTDALHQAGVFVAGEPLQGRETATTVRVRDGEKVTTDGPYAETKEILGGFYLIDVDNLDEALEWAARVPSSRYGSTEVRPLMEIPGP